MNFYLRTDQKDISEGIADGIWIKKILKMNFSRGRRRNLGNK